MPEIIYPSLIILSLVTIFIIIWRKAYYVQSTGLDIQPKTPVIEEAAIPTEELEPPKEEDFSDFWSGVEIQEEKEPMPSRKIVKKVTKEAAPEEMTRAEELFKKGQYISAEKWYIEAAKKTPKESRIYSRLGIIYLEQKNFPDAEEALKEAIRLDDSVSSRLFNLSYTLWCQSKFKESLMYARKATKTDPQNQKYKSWYEKLRSEGF